MRTRSEATRAECRLDRVVGWLFGHRHKWHEYFMYGNNGRIVFQCRECECGADQVNLNPFNIRGGGEWQDKSIPLRQVFENEWLRTAIRDTPPNT